MTMSCDRVSADSGPGARQESLSGQKLEDVYINNYQYPLKWQYFGSETGVSNVYPAFRAGDCTSYDVRFRLERKKEWGGGKRMSGGGRRKIILYCVEALTFGSSLLS